MIDITDESYESDLSEEESNKLLLLCGHAVGPQLPPAAQTVRDAVLATYADSIPKDDNLWALERSSTVAALRAAADQAHSKAHIEDIDYVHQSYVDGWKDALDVILAIADELEA